MQFIKRDAQRKKGRGNNSLGWLLLALCAVLLGAGVQAAAPTITPHARGEGCGETSE